MMVVLGRIQAPVGWLLKGDAGAKAASAPSGTLTHRTSCWSPVVLASHVTKPTAGGEHAVEIDGSTFIVTPFTAMTRGWPRSSASTLKPATAKPANTAVHPKITDQRFRCIAPPHGTTRL